MSYLKSFFLKIKKSAGQRKYIHALIISILSLSILATQLTYPTTDANYRTALLEQMENTQDFRDFTKTLFCYEVTSDSITTAYMLKNPSAYDIPSLTPKLSSFEYKNKTADTNTVYDILDERLTAFQNKDLSSEDEITCQLLTDTLSLNNELSKYPYYEEKLGSSTGVLTNLPITLGEYPLDDKEDVDTYLSLLTQVPDYFKEIIKYEKEREALGLSKQELIFPETISAVDSIMTGFDNGDNSFINTFNERINQMDSLSEEEKLSYCKKNQKYVEKYIIPAYEKIYAYMTKAIANEDGNYNTTVSIDKNTAYGLSTLPQGKDYYTLLTRQATGSSKSPEELITLTENTLQTCMGNVLNTAIENPSLYSYYCENEAVNRYENPEHILELLSFMIRDDYPPLPEIPEYEVKNVSESLASSLSPAFYMVPAIDNTSDNTIYINPLYTNAQNGNLFTTLAHEGFPGHLYQTVYFNGSHPDSIRQILNYPGFVEGWATYVELNSYKYLDYPEDMENLCSLYQGDTIISLAISSRIDLGVNYENWTLQDVENFFEGYGFNSYYAKDLYLYVTQAPANYLSYFIGYCEIEQIKQEYKNLTSDNFSELEFHKQLLEIGPCDFETLKKCMLNSINS